MTDNQKQKRRESFDASKDFSMVLALLPALQGDYRYKGLDKLFSIVGIDRLILLCKYMGGETLRIPTLQSLTDTITALQWYLDVYVLNTRKDYEIPKDDKLRLLISHIKDEIESNNT